MSRGKIRRGQLIAPFGVGAMTVLSNGTGVVAAGLDHWFERMSDDLDPVDTSEFSVEEWRLQNALYVDALRLPPDWRTARFGEQGLKNLRISVPFLRFPTWNFCRYCKRLSKTPLSYRDLKRCEHHDGKGRSGPVMAQVPFVALCEGGHLQDFPFREWVHRDALPSCGGQLYLVGTGAASLAAQLVKCACGKSRNLAGITGATTSDATGRATSFLSDNLLDGDDLYLCPGVSVWHGTEKPEGCVRPLRGSLRAASNVYYALIRSAIYLPKTGAVDEKLLEILTTPPLGPAIDLLYEAGGTVPTPAQLRRHRTGGHLLNPYSDEQVSPLIAKLIEDRDSPEVDQEDHEGEEWDEARFRRPEFDALQVEQNQPQLRVRQAPGAYEGSQTANFRKLMLVERLRETRALWGFNRINAAGEMRLGERKSRLRTAEEPRGWLPAYVVHGEGLFFALDPGSLRTWEARDEVQQRGQYLAHLYERVQLERQMEPRNISPRLLMIHTLSHLLMNRLTFDCGYSSASLRERLFVDDEDMAGVLIYTAAGDSEGTMGGLVRMGRPGLFEPVLGEALANAAWCSADPVCMEAGESGGQGPDSCNLAACHSCALVPETACEEFNRFLDRALVVGSPAEPSLGFFTN